MEEKCKLAPLVIIIEGGMLCGVYTSPKISDAVQVELLDLDEATVCSEDPDVLTQLRQRWTEVENELTQIY